MFDLTDVGFVKRIVVGSTDAENIKRDSDVQAAMDLVNRCLSESPRGRIIGIERSFTLLNVGQHQIVLEAAVYHVGFARRPVWLANT